VNLSAATYFLPGTQASFGFEQDKRECADEFREWLLQGDVPH
jgi:hypothetical protein